MKDLGDGYPTPVFDTFYYKSKVGKVKEEVNYWVIDICDVLSRDITCVINDDVDKTEPKTYGYTTYTHI